MDYNLLAIRGRLRQQIIGDTLQLQGLITRYSRGETSLKSDRDQMKGAVQIKVALLRGLRKPWSC